MSLAFFCSGLSPDSFRLQPWLTLVEVGLRLTAQGHEVHFITDGNRGAGDMPLPVTRFSSLRGTHSAPITRWLQTFRPSRVVLSITPFSLMTARWHRHLDREKTWGCLSYALYTGKEFKTAWPYLRQSDRWSYGRNLLVPGWLWRRRLQRRFAGVICQSTRTADRLGIQVPQSPISHLPSSISASTSIIPPGIDLNAWQPPEPASQEPDRDTFLYLGSARPIRGYTVLLQAMKRLPGHLKLRVLARGLESEAEAELKSQLESWGLANRVRVLGGWQTMEQLKAEIQASLAVVLPFVLVPSEVPVSVLEVIACGTPVIVTDIDGLPESVGEAGVVVPPGDSDLLAGAMQELASKPARVAALRGACLRRRESFQDWNAVSERWAEVLHL